MLKNKNFNFALIVFALTLTLLLAFIQYYPGESVTDAEIEKSETTTTNEDLAASSK